MTFAARIAALFTLAAATTFASAADHSAVWKYVDASTFAVVRMDLATYDRGAFEQWVSATLAANTDKGTADGMVKAIHDAPAVALPDRLKQAGAKEVFAIFTMANLPTSVGCVLIPLPDGVDPAPLARAFIETHGPLDPAPATPEPGVIARGSGLFAVVIDHALLLAPGTPDRYQHFVPADRPDLAKALDAAGDSPIAAAFSPTDDTRKVVEQMMPMLPAPASVPSTVLTHGLRSASLAATLPPQAKLNLVIQSDNPAAATDLSTLLNKFLTIGRNDKGFRRDVPKGDQILDAVTPKVDGDRLVLSLDAAAVDKVTGLFATGLTKARMAAGAAQSMSNQRQMLLGITMYANDHNGDLPDDLKQVSKYLGDKDEMMKLLMTNPQHPDRQPGYVYLKPAASFKDVKSAPDTMILYESFDQWPGQLGIGFADGHCEMISDQAEFQRLLAKTKAMAATK